MAKRHTAAVNKQGLEGFSIDVIFDRYVGHASGVGTAERVNILKSYYGGFQSEAVAKRVYDDVRALLEQPTRRTPIDAVAELLTAAKLLLRAYESVLPGLAHIAVQDYALINEAPIAIERAIRRIEHGDATSISEEYQRYLDSVLDPRD